MPPAVLLALALKPIAYPEGLEIVLGKLGATLAPLALVSVGYQLRLAELRGRPTPASRDRSCRQKAVQEAVAGVPARIFGRPVIP